ncbi:MAG: biotin/lipoyl-binding protein [Actinobacteria bacterium]|nr:biotin/lipoyl-binding protein [Actinomycetota bacterium]
MDITMRTITKVLVANRSEIARRVMRTCHEMGIGTVAVYSDPDREAPFVREADEAVALKGSTPADTYLQIDSIVDAALRTGADAIHPGYGFLSENPELPRSCEAAGISFIGPPALVMEKMGSKLQAKAIMSAAGVPTLPAVEVASFDIEATLRGSSGVAVPSSPGAHRAPAGSLPEARGVSSQEELFDASEKLGWPVLVKASAGGGGRGMRIVRKHTELLEAVLAARREAGSAFGDETVFLERYVEAPRHVEIQIFGDHHGNAVHLFERECSIQRRFQKILEESPSVAVGGELREKMGAAAVAAAKAIGYVGAGTVEFLLTPEDEFFFLEVNTRLQVEHPVTEAITGLDLVRLQILVEEGADLTEQLHGLRINGHAIEVRLYAEDPMKGFLPMTGTLHRFTAPELPGLRIDAGVEQGSVVSPHYDPMLAKVIAHAPTRTEAARLLARGLASLQIHGVVTNRDLLVGLCRNEDFLAGRTDTHFLERHLPSDLQFPPGSKLIREGHAAAAALAIQARSRQQAKVLAFAPSGWRNNFSQPQKTVLHSHSPETEEIEVAYKMAGTPMIEVGGHKLEVGQLYSCTPERVDLELGGIRRSYAVHQVDNAIYVDSSDGSSAFSIVDRLPGAQPEAVTGSLSAPMPGTVVRVAVEAGQRVEAGDVLLVIEAMKMEHSVEAPAPGIVTSVRTAKGELVDTGEILVVLDAIEPEGESPPKTS